MRIGLSIATGLAVALMAPMALAQDAPPTGTGTPDTGGALPPPKVTTQVQTTTTLPAGGTAAAPKPAEEDAISDHEKVVGHVAVGYLGLTSIPIDPPAAGAGNTVSAPVIGVRYWLAERIGLDIGLGLGLTSGSTESVNGAVTNTVDRPSVFGGALHGGVPIVFAHAKHFKFLLVPEFDVGFATATQKQATPANPTAPDISHSGFLFKVGARVGSEIHFGFIGVPQLSLQATVGLSVAAQNRKNSFEVNGSTTSNSTSEFGLGTTVQSDPWALFANSISALYYFP